MEPATGPRVGALCEQAGEALANRAARYGVADVLARVVAAASAGEVTEADLDLLDNAFAEHGIDNLTRAYRSFEPWPEHGTWSSRHGYARQAHVRARRPTDSRHAISPGSHSARPGSTCERLPHRARQEPGRTLGSRTRAARCGVRGRRGGGCHARPLAPASLRTAANPGHGCVRRDRPWRGPQRGSFSPPLWWASPRRQWAVS